MVQFQEKTIIGLIGRTNVGKSSLLNLLSGQKNFAIVDATPGTTADTVTALMEIHNFGPVKILDTAGADEFSALGAKKRQKTFEALEEADLNLVVIDLLKAAETGELKLEKILIQRAQKYHKQVLVIYNLFSKKISPAKIKACQKKLDQILKLPSLVLSAQKLTEQKRLIAFIQKFFHRAERKLDLLPMLKPRGYTVLIIPMDEETPALRLLRPQEMVVERLLRNFQIPVLFRLNLSKARGQNKSLQQAEKQRFQSLLADLGKTAEGLQLVITDSQALDVVTPWTSPRIPLTSFSIVLTNFMSGGKLEQIVKSVQTVKTLKSGDKILIAEACNHNRQCDDIGTIQIPRLLNQKTGGQLNYEFNFGRPFPENLRKFKLIVHCGSCMIDRQKYLRRFYKAQENGVPFINYGILLSYLHSPATLKRVVKTFGVKI